MNENFQNGGFCWAALARGGLPFAQGYVPNERLTYTPTKMACVISGSTGFGARGHLVYRTRVTPVDQTWEPRIVQTLVMSANRAARAFGGVVREPFTLDRQGWTPSPVVDTWRIS